MHATRVLGTAVAATLLIGLTGCGSDDTAVITADEIAASKSADPDSVQGESADAPEAVVGDVILSEVPAAIAVDDLTASQKALYDAAVAYQPTMAKKAEEDFKESPNGTSFSSGSGEELPTGVTYVYQAQGSGYSFTLTDPEFNRVHYTSGGTAAPGSSGGYTLMVQVAASTVTSPDFTSDMDKVQEAYAQWIADYDEAPRVRMDFFEDNQLVLSEGAFDEDLLDVTIQLSDDWAVEQEVALPNGAGGHEFRDPRSGAGAVVTTEEVLYVAQVPITD
jgi:hypothetical protein